MPQPTRRPACGQRLALPDPKWDLSATTSCGGPPTGRWQASLPTTPEAVYLINFQDADWSRFEPDRSYPLRVNADGLRP